MAELLTAAQMRAIEQAAIDSGEVTGLELMERAGHGVVEAIFEEWPELADGADGGPAPQAPRGISEQKKHRAVAYRAVVLCGPGNNGGDGFVVARLLFECGWAVEVFLYGDAERLPPDARVNYERWGEMGEVLPLRDEQFDGWPDENSGVSLIVDAVFGTGLARAFTAFRQMSITLHTCASLARERNLFPRIVAIDVPSGLCADSGRWLAEDQPLDFANIANLTVSFHSLKTGHLLADGPSSCGSLRTVDIGLSGTSAPGSLSRSALIRSSGERRLGRVICRSAKALHHTFLSKSRDVHKYAHGHALILSGGAGKTGAARLAARGALRIGAGLVTLGVPGAAQMEVASQITALMLRRVEDGAALAEVLEDARLNALCLGPGLGLGEDKAALVRAALDGQRATVLDADALTLMAEHSDLVQLLHPNCLLTPHAGEFRRLFPDIMDKLQAPPTKGPAFSKVDATREAAQRAGCTVLFKGPDTVIADPSGRCSINSAHYDREAPWLATAGSGDVLAGFVTGLLARGFDPMQAAETGAYCHVECARSFGPGLIAEDLPEELPKVFRALGV